ncbi:MAG: vitamin B12 dependent methionine synthase, activation domain protein [Oscillospiraceae bacterium]|nr:vitamin B12 dependent methionine synthase, activation domain protein [Oscillospiraceae bacterium]
MEPRLTGINEREALLYLGYRGGEIPAGIRTDLERCRDTILKTARPRAVWREFPLNPDGSLEGTAFRPEGNDVKELLRQCHHVILFGATLGAEVETLLRRAQVQNMADAVMLDCCASAAIENVCDNLCADLQEELEGYLTDRFSPGYGDLPFAQQPEFCRVLDLHRRIGVSLSPGGLMIPQKSVTALMGRSDRPQTRRFRGCAVCSRFETCELRKRGDACGQAE